MDNVKWTMNRRGRCPHRPAKVGKCRGRVSRPADREAKRLPYRLCQTAEGFLMDNGQLTMSIAVFASLFEGGVTK